MRLRNYTDFTSLSRLQQDSQRLIPCLHNQIVIVSKRRCSHQTSCHKILLNLLSCLKVLQEAPRDVAFMNSHQCWHGLYGGMVALQSFLLLWVLLPIFLWVTPVNSLNHQVGFWYHQSGMRVASYLGKVRSCSVYFWKHHTRRHQPSESCVSLSTAESHFD